MRLSSGASPRFGDQDSTYNYQFLNYLVFYVKPVLAVQHLCSLSSSAANVIFLTNVECFFVLISSQNFRTQEENSQKSQELNPDFHPD